MAQEDDLKRLRQRLEKTNPEKAKRLDAVMGKGSESGSSQSQKPKRKAQLSLKEVVIFLMQSRHIRCLAVMAIAQGLSTNLLDVAWKSHLHLLHPSPAAYSVSMFPLHRCKEPVRYVSRCKMCAFSDNNSLKDWPS